MSIILNNNQIQDILPANINTTQLRVFTPCIRDIQDKSKDVPLMENTGGIEDNDKSEKFSRWLRSYLLNLQEQRN